MGCHVIIIMVIVIILQSGPGINAGDEIHPPWIAPWDSTIPMHNNCENKRGDCAGKEKYCHR